MDNPGITLFFGIIIFILVRLMIGAVSKAKDEGVQYYNDDENEEEGFEDLYEEARRQILKRQNQQPGGPPAPPPEPARPAVFQPWGEEQSSAPPPLPAFTPAVPAAPAKPQTPALSAAEKAALARVQARRTAPSRSPSGVTLRGGTPAQRVRQMLANPQSTRDAIVVAEVIGKPKGM